MRPNPRRGTSANALAARILGAEATRRRPSVPVRARPGRSSALSVCPSKSVLYVAFVWARGALNSQKNGGFGPGQRRAASRNAEAMLASMLAGASISEQPGVRGASAARIREAFQASARAANSRGPGGFTGPLRTPLGSSPDRGSAVGSAPALVPGPLARLQELQLLTELSPQASAHVKATPEAMEELCAGLQNKLELVNGRVTCKLPRSRHGG